MPGQNKASASHRLRLSRYATILDDGAGGWLVHSGLTGAVVRLSKAHVVELQAWQSPDTNPDEDVLVRWANQKVRERLAQTMILVDDDSDERWLLWDRYQKESIASPLSFVIAPTMQCDLRCPYCYNPKHRQVMAARTRAEVAAFVRGELCRDSQRCPTVFVTWVGGEPLLDMAGMTLLAQGIAEGADEYGADIMTKVVTNGTHLAEVVAQQLAARPYRVREVQVTLDAPRERHDRQRVTSTGDPTFDAIIRNVTHASKHVPLTLRINVDLSTTIADVSRLLDELMDMEVVEAGMSNPQIELRPIYATSCIGNDALTQHFADLECHAIAVIKECRLRYAETLALSPKAVPCGAVTHRQWVIDSEGYLYRCQELMGRPGRACGHVSTGWTPAAKDAHEWHAFDPTNEPICRDCRVLPLCMGGCIADHVRDPQCPPRCRAIRYSLEKRLRLMQ